MGALSIWHIIVLLLFVGLPLVALGIVLIRDHRDAGKSRLGEGAMQESNLTFDRLLKIWWLLIWRGCVIGFVAGMVAGAVAGAAAGFIAASEGHPEMAQVAARAAGFGAGLIVYFPVSLLVISMALRKRYRDFRIALVPAEAA